VQQIVVEVVGIPRNMEEGNVKRGTKQEVCLLSHLTKELGKRKKIEERNVNERFGRIASEAREDRGKLKNYRGRNR